MNIGQLKTGDLVCRASSTAFISRVKGYRPVILSYVMFWDDDVGGTDELRETIFDNTCPVASWWFDAHTVIRNGEIIWEVR